MTKFCAVSSFLTIQFLLINFWLCALPHSSMADLGPACAYGCWPAGVRFLVSAVRALIWLCRQLAYRQLWACMPVCKFVCAPIYLPVCTVLMPVLGRIRPSWILA
jgi:hypothetical protein